MKIWNKNIPEGTCDYIFEEAKNKLDLAENVRSLFTKRGYKDIITPTIEFYDVFSSPGRIVNQETMYKLFDKNGRILVLRPDMTAPIARIAGTKFSDLKSPIKICYVANVFRINESYNGKPSEVTQAGIEIIGTKSVKADAEAIITGVRSLLSLGINDFVIEIGHAGFFNSITGRTNLSEDEKESIRELIESKNYAGLDTYLSKNLSIKDSRTIKMLSVLPDLFGGIEILNYAEEHLNCDGTKEAIDDIKEVYTLIKDSGLDKYIMFDFGMVHELHYYTGIIFRGYSNLLGQDIISGGRYDSLISNFGSSMPSTGMALYLDNILSIKKKMAISNDNEEKIIVYFNRGYGKTAYSLCDYLNEKAFTNEISLCENEESTLLYAKVIKAKYVICIYNEENIALKYGENSTSIVENMNIGGIMNIFNGGLYGTSENSSY
jgi:ATP phosphoribosyltransferase regulatory subunit